MTFVFGAGMGSFGLLIGMLGLVNFEGTVGIYSSINSKGESAGLCTDYDDFCDLDLDSWLISKS